ncbi:MAG TPA: efflux RND transporter periplasmic adaptor subunit [Burkholderiales bacterium]|nr:efflux RND transporter periplasmic adaptor subunit [Burkholderiales bacterium]
MRARVVVAAALVLLSAGFAGAAWWWHQRQDRGVSDVLVLHGNVDIREVQLAFDASDRIEKVLVREGERVTAGQLLAVLDSRRLRHAAAQAQAQVAAQREVVARFVAGSRPEEIRKAQADVEAARADAVNAEETYRRTAELVAQHFVAEQQADNAKAALDAARARLKSAEETLTLAVQGPRKEDTAAAKATLAAYQAALELAKRDLAAASLYAPADGVIENRVLEPGDMASPQRTVLTLALTDPLWVRAYAPETDLGKLRLGAWAEVATDSYPGKRYRGWVGFISPTAEFTPKSVETQEVRTALVYQVRVFICPPHDELRLGMPATVLVALRPVQSAEPSAFPDACKTGP